MLVVDRLISELPCERDVSLRFRRGILLCEVLRVEQYLVSPVGFWIGVVRHLCAQKYIRRPHMKIRRFNDQFVGSCAERQIKIVRKGRILCVLQTPILVSKCSFILLQNWSKANV